MDNDIEEQSGLQVGPVRRTQKKEAVPAQTQEPAKVGPSGQYAVMAPYWLDGMHNVEGLALEEELNAALVKAGLDRNAVAIAKWLKEQKRAAMFELEVVPIEQLVEDEHRRANLARPDKLLGGELVRDRDGAYRPKAGGKAVLEDKGESLSVKGKSEQAYRAMIELAKAKGWTAIELTGNKKQLPDAWLEAKLQNLEVVNYTPTKEDQQRLAERLAKVGIESPKAEQPSIGIEAKPGVATNQQSKTIYTVIHDGDAPEATPPEFGEPKSAAICFAGIPADKLPTVLRSEIGVDGKKTAGIMVAGTGYGDTPGSFVKSADPDVDRAFADALAQNYEVKRTVALVEKATGDTPGMYAGRILRIDGDKVVQKVGREHGQVVYHDIKKLSHVPTIGQVAEIRFGKDGIGQVAERGAGLQLG